MPTLVANTATDKTAKDAEAAFLALAKGLKPSAASFELIAGRHKNSRTKYFKKLLKAWEGYSLKKVVADLSNIDKAINTEVALEDKVLSEFFHKDDNRALQELTVFMGRWEIAHKDLLGKNKFLKLKFQLLSGIVERYKVGDICFKSGELFSVHNEAISALV